MAPGIFVFFEPFLIGPLLAILAYGTAYGPSRVQDPVLQLIGKQSFVTPQTTIKVLSVLFALGALGKVNSCLSAWASNNFRLSHAKKWDWSRGKELAVVTGGSGGIGQAMVEQLAAKGVRVVVMDIAPLPKKLEENELVDFSRCDLSNMEEIKKVTDEIKSKFGDPSILINNAGTGSLLHSILSAPAPSLQTIFAVNLLSHWATVQAFVPSMVKKDKGHVVSMASMSSFVTIPNAVAYSASKAGLLSFHEGLTLELKLLNRTAGVLTSVVHPTWVRTKLVKDIEDRIDSVDGGMLTAEEVARRTTDQVFQAKGGQVIVPSNIVFATGIRAWPSWMGILARNFVGRLTGGI